MRRVFITGASAGLGAALARHYAGADTSMGLFARRRDLLEALASSLPGRTAIYPSDISDAAAIAAAAKDYIARFARAIAAKRRLAVIPWQMALVSLLLRALPGAIYDRLAARAPRKPRDVQI